MPAPPIFVYHPEKERLLGNMSEGKEFAKKAIWDIEDVNAVAIRHSPRSSFAMTLEYTPMEPQGA